jgi:hypothetical protein
MLTEHPGTGPESRDQGKAERPLWVFVGMAPDGEATMELRIPGPVLREEVQCLPPGGELLLFRPKSRMVCVPVGLLEKLGRKDALSFPSQDPIEIKLCLWRCGRLAGSQGAVREAEHQVAALNQCLVSGCAPADSGIRARIAAVRDAPDLSLDRPSDLDCFSPIEPASLELQVVDVYLHNYLFSARACPMRNRIFLGVSRLDRFTLAHEFAHLLGMPQRAHVDDNPWLTRGNVMDTTPVGGKGALTLGQLCVFNLDVQSLAARIRANRDSRFPLRRCLNERAEPVRGPNLGFHFPAG